MIISHISIQRFRSFEQLSFSFQNYTVIVGQNNVGKSNLLRALDIFFHFPFAAVYVGNHFISFRDLVGRGPRYEYNFDRDYPVKLQSSKGSRSTVLEIKFCPIDADYTKFKLDEKFRKFKEIDIKQTVKIVDKNVDRITFSSKMLNEADLLIFVKWLFQSTDFVYIPPTRGHVASDKLLRTFSRRIFVALRGSHKVKKSLQELAQKAKQQLTQAEQSIQERMVRYLPDLVSIKLELDEFPEVDELMKVAEARLDDGTPTLLANKGDGIQSLFFMGLLQYMASLKTQSNLIFGVEEPEIHLHPDAQVELAKVLKMLVDQNNQVVLTTHSSIFVDYGSSKSNIVIERNKKTKNIEPTINPSIVKIREVLGVRPQDNLRNAQLILLVEGETEAVVLRHLAKLVDTNLKLRLDDGSFVVDHKKGAPGMVAYLDYLKRNCQPCLALFDSDTEGLLAMKRCRDENILEANELFNTPISNNCKESEFEDMFPVKYKLLSLKESFQIDIDENTYNAIYRSTGSSGVKLAKWKDVLKKILSQYGRSTDQSSIDIVTTKWSEQVCAGCSTVEEIPAPIKAIFSVVSQRLS